MGDVEGHTIEKSFGVRLQADSAELESTQLLNDDAGSTERTARLITSALILLAMCCAPILRAAFASCTKAGASPGSASADEDEQAGVDLIQSDAESDGSGDHDDTSSVASSAVFGAADRAAGPTGKRRNGA